jgi:hypothetical protein
VKRKEEEEEEERARNGVCDEGAGGGEANLALSEVFGWLCSCLFFCVVYLAFTTYVYVLCSSRYLGGNLAGV